MKRISTFILFALLAINCQSFSQCISGDCQNGYGKCVYYKVAIKVDGLNRFTKPLPPPKYDTNCAQYRHPTYEGNFKNGKCNGNGVFYFHCCYWAGSWVDDKMLVNGEYYDRSSLVTACWYGKAPLPGLLSPDMLPIIKPSLDNTTTNNNSPPKINNHTSPIITWQNPSENPYSTSDSTITIKAKITCSSKPTVTYYTDTKSIKILHMPRIIKVGDSITKAGDSIYYFKDRIRIVKGKNIVQIIAKAGDSSALSKELVINRTDSKIPPEKRLALVIGNADYKYVTSLYPYCINDAEDMSLALKELGFDTIKRIDLNGTGMKSALDYFANKLKNYDVGLFYYSGHGVVCNDSSYLANIDGKYKENINDNEDFVNKEAIKQSLSVDGILNTLKNDKNKTIIIIFDACRNSMNKKALNTPLNIKAFGAEQKQIQAPQNFVLSYASSNGQFANVQSKNGRNSLFTEGLLKYIKTPNLSLTDMLTKVEGYVIDYSSKQDTIPQVPTFNGAPVEIFYFNKK